MEKTRSLISFTLGFGLLALLPFSGWAQAPAITSQPGPQTVLEGQTAGFSITATGSGLAYQWRRGTTNLVNGGNILGATSATLTITNAAPSNAVVNLNCFITNSFGSVTSRSAGIWILNDNDRDLMADFWETAYALNTNNAADRKSVV